MQVRYPDFDFRDSVPHWGDNREAVTVINGGAIIPPPAPAWATRRRGQYASTGRYSPSSGGRRACTAARGAELESVTIPAIVSAIAPSQLARPIPAGGNVWP